MSNKLLILQWSANKLVVLFLAWIIAYTFFAIIPNISPQFDSYYSGRGSILFYSIIAYLLMCLVILSLRLCGKIGVRLFFTLDIIFILLFGLVTLILSGNYGFVG
ncbi:hypothetical protein [Microbulbifer sp. TYP-18]|uniref:hypothetical protein n=1 Tax=Microbulbifer sp. TYP-18 TaxID=3230024 RepID=UPI0034C68432